MADKRKAMDSDADRMADISSSDSDSSERQTLVECIPNRSREVPPENRKIRNEYKPVPTTSTSGGQGQASVSSSKTPGRPFMSPGVEEMARMSVSATKAKDTTRASVPPPPKTGLGRGRGRGAAPPLAQQLQLPHRLEQGSFSRASSTTSLQARSLTSIDSDLDSASGQKASILISSRASSVQLEAVSSPQPGPSTSTLQSEPTPTPPAQPGPSCPPIDYSQFDDNIDVPKDAPIVARFGRSVLLDKFRQVDRRDEEYDLKSVKVSFISVQEANQRLRAHREAEKARGNPIMKFDSDPAKEEKNPDHQDPEA